jgi:hypothetical protein
MPAFAALRRHRRLPKPSTLVEWAARVGYGARGFVYLSAGLLTLLAATDRIGDAVGTGGAAGWLAEQPFGRLWLVLLGVGLWAFVGWRALQAVFDADHEGADLKGWATRAGQALSGVFYGVLAAGVFEYLDEVGEAASAAADQAESVAENQEKAAMLLGLPFGGALLATAGLAILAVGIGNIVRAFRDDFDAALACPESFCRPATILARTGYAARGFAYLPLGVFVILAGLHARAVQGAAYFGVLRLGQVLGRRTPPSTPNAPRSQTYKFSHAGLMAANRGVGADCQRVAFPERSGMDG